MGALLAKLGQYICASYAPKMANLEDQELVMLELDLAQSGISKAQLNEVSHPPPYLHL
jgi:hypothetical protein